MGDPGAPPLRPRELLGALDRHGVKFVVVGGLAAVAHGATRATFNLDITPAWNPRNLDRLAAALGELHAKLRVPGADPVEFPPDAESLRNFEVSTWRTDHGDLDIVAGTPSKDGLAGYDRLTKHAESRSVYGITIEIASLDDVIESKATLNREVDRLALPELYRLRDASAL